jgi:hypothetical protein
MVVSHTLALTGTLGGDKKGAGCKEVAITYSLFPPKITIDRSKCTRRIAMSSSNNRFITDKEFSQLKDYDYYNPAVWYKARSKHKNEIIYVRRISPDGWVAIGDSGCIRRIKSVDSRKQFTVCRKDFNHREVASNNAELDQLYHQYLNSVKWKHYYATCSSGKHNMKEGDKVFAKIQDQSLLLNKDFCFLLLPITGLEKRNVLLATAAKEATQKALNFKHYEHRFWSNGYLHNRHQYKFNCSRIYVRRNNDGCWVIFDGKKIKVIDPDDGISPFTFSTNSKLSDSKNKEIHSIIINKGLYKHSSTYEMSLEEEVKTIWM